MKKFSIFMLALIFAVLAGACGSGGSSAPAQENTPASAQGEQQQSAEKKELNTIAAAAGYEGADREQLIIEGARKEGTLNFYTSIAEKDLALLVQDFEQKYGVKVNAWRAGTDEVLQRIVSEAQANRHIFDAVHVSGPEMEALVRENLLHEVKSPHLNDLLPELIMPHKQYAVTMMTFYVQAYNTNAVKKEDLPQSYEELLDAKWRGKLALEAKDYDWFLAVVKDLGEEKGIQLFRDIVKTNGITVHKGHSLLNNFVISGEVPLALTLYHYMPEQSKKEGAPIDWFTIGSAYARLNGVGVSKNAPHPNAAVLFYDYLISEGQKILADLDYHPANTKVESKFKDVNFTLIDSAEVLDGGAKWDALYEEIFVQRK